MFRLTIGCASSCRHTMFAAPGAIPCLIHVVLQYCFLLTQRGQYDLADEILRHILVSNAYQARVHQDSIRLALISKPHYTTLSHHPTNNAPTYSLRHRYTALPRRRRTRTETDHSTPVQQRTTAHTHCSALQWAPSHRRVHHFYITEAPVQGDEVGGYGCADAGGA